MDEALAPVNGDTTQMPTGCRARGRLDPASEEVAWAVAALLRRISAGTRHFHAAAGLVPAEAPAYRSTILVHENLSSRATSHRFKLSPDGRRLAYVAPDASGRVNAVVRAFDSLAGQPLAGTDDANAPFWSPDSRFIALLRRPEGQTD
mgnify:CR=1 FL=1